MQRWGVLRSRSGDGIGAWPIQCADDYETVPTPIAVVVLIEEVLWPTKLNPAALNL